MQLPDVNLIREAVRQLLNIIEAQATELAAARAENQQLRDALARLKGGSGKPTIKPSVQPPPTDHSSEQERQTRIPRGKPKKNETLTVSSRSRSSALCVRSGSFPKPIRPSLHRCQSSAVSAQSSSAILHSQIVGNAAQSGEPPA